MGSQRSNRCQRTVNRFLRGGLWLLALLASLAVSQAGEAPDGGLLEFLGSVDSEDKDWNEYLARTDIDNVARRAGKPSSNPGGGSEPARVKLADPPAAAATPAAPPIAAKPVAPP
jgi:hypothetical protein